MKIEITLNQLVLDHYSKEWEHMRKRKHIDQHVTMEEYVTFWVEHLVERGFCARVGRYSYADKYAPYDECRELLSKLQQGLGVYIRTPDSCQACPAEGTLLRAIGLS